MTITNETIIKAANAANIDIKALDEFDPVHNGYYLVDIITGAKIDVEWYTLNTDTEYHYVWATSEHLIGGRVGRVGRTEVLAEHGHNKQLSLAHAVILCAAAKWDAMQRDVE